MVKLKENMFNGSIFLQSYVLLKLTPDMRNVISLNCVHHVRQNINNSLKPLSELLCAIQNLNPIRKWKCPSPPPRSITSCLHSL